MLIRNATRSDAKDLAYLINLAGEGLPEFLWRGMAEDDETPMDVGTRRAARDEGNFSYRHALVCEDNDAVLGMVLAYRQPDPYGIDDISEFPLVIRPLLLLEEQTPGSWYINAIATREQHRGKGVARRLMQATEVQASAAGCDAMSLIVASGNTVAKRMYERMGFEEIEAMGIIPYPGCLHGGDWVLMNRRVSDSGRRKRGPE